MYSRIIFAIEDYLELVFDKSCFELVDDKYSTYHQLIINLNLAAELEYLYIIKKYNQRFSCQMRLQSDKLFEIAVKNGCVKICQWFVDNYNICYYRDYIFSWAANNGNIEMCEWVKANYPNIQPTYFAFDWAARNGHIKMCQWYRENYPSTLPTIMAMIGAANNDKIEMCKWLKITYPDIFPYTLSIITKVIVIYGK